MCAARNVSRQNPPAKRMDDGARAVRFAVMARMVAFRPGGAAVELAGLCAGVVRDD